MRQKPDMNATPFLQAVGKIFSRIAESFPQISTAVDAYLSGGVAMHILTGMRVSDDVDTIFSRRVILPQDLVVTYRDGQGEQRILQFDYNDNPDFGLLHPDFMSRAVRMAWKDDDKIHIRCISAVDLFTVRVYRSRLILPQGVV